MLNRNRPDPHFVLPIKIHPSSLRKGKMLRTTVDGKMACGMCKKWTPLTEFYIRVNKKTGGKYYDTRCNPCRKARMVARLRMIPVEEYQRLIATANGCCEICKEEKKNLVIDHCHASEGIRGVLCVRCNTTLGLIKDRRDLAMALADYLQRHRKP